MTDDLHDIDGLFKNGLDGYEENVPPSVWQGVNNDLDKKQVLFYKAKYHRLKRAALILVLLFFLGGGYFTYHALSKKQTHTEEEKHDAVTQTTPQQAAKENHRQSPLNKPDDLQRETEEQKKDNTVSNAIAPSISSSTKQQIGKREKGLSVTESTVTEPALHSATKQNERSGQTNSRVVNEHTAVRNSTFNQIIHNREIILTEETNTKRKDSETENVHTTQPTSVPILTDPLHYFPLLEWNHHFPETTIKILSENSMFSLPEERKPSAIKTANHFSLSAFAAPNLSFDRLEDDGHLAGPGQNRHDVHREENENISFSGGLLMNYELSKKWSLQSGVTITYSSTSIAPKTIYAKADNNGHTYYELHCSAGYVYLLPKDGAQPMAGDSAQSLGSMSKLMYVTVPVAASLRIRKGSFLFSPTIGVGLNKLISGKATTTLLNVKTESPTTTIIGLKPTYIDGNFGIGVEYSLNNKLSFGLRPNARLALTPINQGTPVRSYQNFLSLETGVRIKF